MRAMESTSSADGPVEKWIALLGRRDTPTDGVEDYCSFLGQALTRHNVELRKVHVPWAEEGWLRALRHLWSESAGWRESWVLLQYTAMAWSRRGFPFGALAALSLLRRQGVRCAIVFHEPSRQPGRRSVDWARARCQEWVIRKLYSAAAKAIFADPLDKIGWLPKGTSKAVFIPIGANIPEIQPEGSEVHNHNGNTKTVAVFCLSDQRTRQRELGDIVHAIRFLAQQGLRTRVIFLGRGTAEAREEIERLFRSTTAEVRNLGLQSARDISRILSASDVMLCVRGPLFSTRGSAIAGIACGLPIVGYAGAAEGPPLEDAGVELVPYLDREALGTALAHVLTDPKVLLELRRKSVLAQQRHFSWDVIASKLINALGSDGRAQE
jgi:glycosyltransferase involved in cell wall biosynthesis